MLCDGLEGWDGRGKEVQEERDIYIKLFKNRKNWQPCAYTPMAAHAFLKLLSAPSPPIPQVPVWPVGI